MKYCNRLTNRSLNQTLKATLFFFRQNYYRFMSRHCWKISESNNVPSRGNIPKGTGTFVNVKNQVARPDIRLILEPRRSHERHRERPNHRESVSRSCPDQPYRRSRTLACRQRKMQHSCVHLRTKTNRNERRERCARFSRWVLRYNRSDNNLAP